MAMQFVNTVELKNQTNRIIRQVKSDREPVVVTQHGKPAVAIVPLGIDSLKLDYDREFMKSVREGLADLKAGRTVSLKAFAKKHLR